MSAPDPATELRTALVHALMICRRQNFMMERAVNRLQRRLIVANARADAAEDELQRELERNARVLIGMAGADPQT